MKRLALILGMAAAVMPASAEWSKDIDFESGEGYKSLSMYDCWETSPFRTGALTLIPMVVNNPDKAENDMLQAVPNPSENVAGGQRSRFGSNRFGLRVDLSEDNYFELTPEVKYVHVKLLKPAEGRVLLVGLGSRDDVPDQEPYVEQFWEVSQNGYFEGNWTDMVFAIKGAGGITMRSFVLVPDLESPHNYTSDFLFYIDDIKVNTTAAPEFRYEYYGTSFDKSTATLNRNDRYSTFVELKGSKYGNQQISLSQQSDRKAYQDRVNELPMVVEAGERVTPNIGYEGTWMNSCCYIDYNRDGRFSVTEGADTELVSKSEQGTNNHTLPAFTVPANLEPGLYRMRYKIDWNDTTPEGHPGDASVENSLIKNGGVIVDVMLNVVAPGAKASVSDFQLNGEILAGNGDKLSSYEVNAFEDFEVLVAPENGFENNGFTLKCGYGTVDTEGSANRYNKYGNPNYFVVDFPLSVFSKGNNYFTVPGKYMFGKVLLLGRMAQVGTIEPFYNVNFDKEQTISRTDRHLDKVTFKSEGGKKQEISLADNTNPRYVYVEKLETPIEVEPGQKVATDIGYTGNAMHMYLYVDYDDNGFFTPLLTAGGVPEEGSEVVSFTYYNGKNSVGDNISNAGSAPRDVMPDFTVPGDLTPGIYRARFKVDWNEINPTARSREETNNKIWENGGAVLDFHFKVGHPVAVESVVLSAEELSLEVGQTSTLTASVKPDDATETTVRWSSSNSTVATVNSQGVVTAIAVGNAFVAAACGDVSADCAVTVTAKVGEDGISEILTDDNNSKTYDLLGRRVKNPGKGSVVITNGKLIRL